MNSSSEKKLAGETVIVIGAGSGIGLACATEARRRGAKVIICGRNAERLNQAKASISGNGVEHFVVDVKDELSVSSLFESVGEFQHVIVCAAETVSASVIGSDSRKMQATVESRLWGGYYVAKHAAPRMQTSERPGSITYTSGLSAHRPYPGSAVIAASTGAIEAFTRALALELAPTRVNAVCPGLVDTPLLEGFYGEDRDDTVRQISKKLPVGRIGKPEEIADAALFLAGNGFVTGTILKIDGGGSLV